MGAGPLLSVGSVLLVRINTKAQSNQLYSGTLCHVSGAVKLISQVFPKARNRKWLYIKSNRSTKRPYARNNKKCCHVTSRLVHVWLTLVPTDCKIKKGKRGLVVKLLSVLRLCLVAVKNWRSRRPLRLFLVRAQKHQRIRLVCVLKRLWV